MLFSSRSDHCSLSTDHQPQDPHVHNCALPSRSALIEPNPKEHTFICQLVESKLRLVATPANKRPRRTILQSPLPASSAVLPPASTMTTWIPRSRSWIRRTFPI